jgi:hypothetical protein
VNGGSGIERGIGSDASCSKASGKSRKPVKSAESGRGGGLAGSGDVSDVKDDRPDGNVDDEVDQGGRGTIVGEAVSGEMIVIAHSPSDTVSVPVQSTRRLDARVVRLADVAISSAVQVLSRALYYGGVRTEAEEKDEKEDEDEAIEDRDYGGTYIVSGLSMA